MNLITISGPPSSGKTSIITKTIESLKSRGINVGVVKFDCLYTDDDKIYEKLGVPVKKGLSGSLCPDHYFVSNIEEVVQWGIKKDLDLKTRVFKCDTCDSILDRDLNASINIKRVGASTLAGEVIRATSVA